MAMGEYDQHEYERREQTIGDIDSSADERATEFRGSITFEMSESASDLLENFRKLTEDDA
ncbi:hypothetical protein G6M89_17155 [Natronolimnobius sp. AArcel1]|uniref:DUF5786 family protein n=1 Tax=Natronolimnobius sp. AArcel1 TaxID=1679093 RepID=UPI0013EA9CA7|nr:DUF5786 family protein [Natronolimnobius sp. AArcel1]NGM70714.1 hypothetical protein [Natronolimnobius sp. AArcel1]